VFVTGAAGGVGLAAVDLARQLGLRVVAGVGSDEKAGLVRAYGAFDVINYRSEDLRERIKSITGEKASIFASTMSAERFLSRWRG
jgi:NADPH2:quinone reductase